MTEDHPTTEAALEPSPHVGDDVLARALRELAAPLYAHLERAFEGDAYARLESRESGSSRRIVLGDVFVDLPIQGHDRGFVSTILSEPSPRETSHDAPERAPAPREVPWGRVALVGGPGQGKTTLGQYLCQRHRVAWLRGRGRALEPRLETLVSSFEKGAARDELPVAFRARVPFRVTLYRFAERLATGEVDGLAAELRLGLLGPATGDESHELLLETLASVPTLLVLDGLDEVPASSNRAEVVDAVEHFLSNARAPKVLDLQVIGTTRPQGYHGEWSRRRWREVTLSTLSTDVALHYASQLVQQRHPGDSDRQYEVLARVRGALEGPDTAGLGQSPLQVTILVSLLERLARAPRDRWRLFREYFRVIYDRERERGLRSVEVLSDHEEVVRRLHWEVGLRLHLAEEHNEPPLGDDELRAIIARLLESDGYAQSAREKLTAEILEATRDRLVFLVPVAADRVGFELRSLQEFAAGEWLMAGSDDVVVERFRAVAPASHWRNVAMFIVGHVALERDHLWPRIEAWLLDEGTSDPVAMLARPGGRLALELVRAGVGMQRPRVDAGLRRAVRQVTPWLGRPGALAAATRLVPPDHVDWERAAAEGLDATATWVMALSLADSGDEDARIWAERHWLEAPFEALVPFFNWAASSWAWRLLEENPFVAAPEFWWRLEAQEDGPVVLLGPKTESWKLLESCIYFAHNDGVDMYSSECELTSRYGGRLLTGEVWLAPRYHRQWAFLFEEGRQFAKSPSIKTLTSALRRLSSRVLLPDEPLSSVLTWPLACLLGLARAPRDLDAMAAWVTEGKLGDVEDWLILQDAVANGAIEASLWDRCAALGEELTEEGILASFPFPTQLYSRERASDDTWKQVQRAQARLRRLDLADLVLAGAPGQFAFLNEPPLPPRRPTDPEVIASLAATKGIGSRGARFLNVLSDMPTAERLSLLDVVGRRERVTLADETRLPWLSPKDAFDPGHPGLLAWLAALVRAARPKVALERPPRLPDPGLPPRLLADAVHIWLAVPDVTIEELRGLAGIAATHALSEPDFLSDLDDVRNGWLAPFWVAFAAATPERGDVRRAASDFLAAIVEERLSLLGGPEARERLGITTVHIDVPEDTMSTDHSDATGAIYWLSRAELRDFRGFESLELDFSTPKEGRGQWIFLAGDNGLGKTTILRAMVLALLPRPDSQKFVAEATAPWARIGAVSKALASVVVAGPGPFEISIDGRTVEKSANAELPCFVVAYGSRRGTAIGERDLDEQGTLDAVRSLFDDDARLIDAQEWLKDADYRAMKNGDDGSTRRLFDSAVAILCDLLELDALDVNPDGVEVSSPSLGLVPFKALSDGYLTIAGWIVDMMARWALRERNAGRSIPARFNEVMTGLAVIDEVDLHLHPRWQHQLIESLRGSFPKMSFVVTTHNPVTLIGSRPGEVHVLSRASATGELVVEQRDLPPAASVDTLLTGDWFGLATTMDRDTLELLERHRLANREAPDSPETAALRAEVATRLGRPLSKDLAHLAFRAMDEVAEAELSAMTAEQREAANARLKEALRRRLADKRAAS
ncbi:MAG: AAA family ATPase [Myxococcales bacterium]|nr:AAA family ATPase [Myxococcales bacterium]